ncbi:predicted protein [Sclerotinia sclerotiorum 1980 UF-70]|uniref:Uncharacterized protein n=2 Tax=Sclerotinia sclerotiorum (strain ATCC 18683 / 1980 / Ss-1) TaxID=665079 RepID=A7EAX9_SCLS1|nr:predicted protein [Sclerotinia sclerotiorum 1980 UF-70]APA08712.1 hypothetical protein sscle_04g034820 [Sclerotinia sclerotiorum 1980 UF-70]EDN99607.1 predicted protein [Sclerotinia sclerotiorum 1980 UF-70]
MGFRWDDAFLDGVNILTLGLFLDGNNLIIDGLSFCSGDASTAGRLHEMTLDE